MKAYFDGLMVAVSEREDIPKTTASFDYVKAKKDFAASGQVTFYEAFFKKKVISLYANVAGKRCQQTGKYFVRFEFSPQPKTNPVWEGFKEVKLNVDCGD